MWCPVRLPHLLQRQDLQARFANQATLTCPWTGTARFLARNAASSITALVPSNGGPHRASPEGQNGTERGQHGIARQEAHEDGRTTPCRFFSAAAAFRGRFISETEFETMQANLAVLRLTAAWEEKFRQLPEPARQTVAKRFAELPQAQGSAPSHLWHPGRAANLHEPEPQRARRGGTRRGACADLQRAHGATSEAVGAQRRRHAQGRRRDRAGRERALCFRSSNRRGCPSRVAGLSVRGGRCVGPVACLQRRVRRLVADRHIIVAAVAGLAAHQG